MMLFQALIILIATIFLPAVYSRPSVSRKNDGNGNFGYQYEVSHYPGNSRVHLNTGGASKVLSHPGHGTHIHQGDGYVHHQPVSSEYHANNYDNRAKPTAGYENENSPHASEIIHEPQSFYPPPYDSVAKNNHNSGLPAHGDISLSQSNSLVPQENIYPPLSQDHNNHAIPQEYINPPVSQEHVNPHISQEYINPPVSDAYNNAPVSQSLVNPHISQEYINPPVPDAYNNAPVSQDLVNPHISQEHINAPISQDHISPPISQDHINPPLPQEHINPPISQVHINPPLSQDHINPPLSQDHINPSNSEIAPELLNEQIHVQAFDLPNKPLETVPVGTKYQFIPSGPPYVTDSHSTHIIHPPLPDSPDKVPTEIVHPTHTLDRDSPPIDGVKTSPISHSFRLPVPALSSFPTGSSVDQIPVDQSSHSDGILPAAPISHSTRLLIPGPIIAEGSDVSDILPRSQLNLESPESFHTLADIGAPISSLSPTGDLEALQMNSAVGNIPGSLVLPQHGPLSDSPIVPPISHAFRLSLPQVAPSKEVASALDVPSVAEIESSSDGLSNTPRISHAFRLHLPSAATFDRSSHVPQVQCDQEVSKSLDSGLLALETKITE